MQKIFDPKHWLAAEKSEEPKNDNAAQTVNTKYDEVEKVLRRLEENSIDITQNYSDWLNIGFALSEEFGENGRDFFHRVSRMYSDYDFKEADSQYTNCLKSQKKGVTLKTFFYKAKEAGVAINPKNCSEDNNKNTSEKDSEISGEFTNDIANPVREQLPNFPDALFPQLPEFLQKVIKVAVSNEERDILLIGSIAAISGCLPKLFGIYDGRKIYPNLFLFITAQASAGKGRLIHCRQLINPIHKELRDQAKALKQHYEIELARYNAAKGKEENAEKPAKPPEKMLFIPANNSSTGAYQLLGDSDGRGIIFETEGDTLAQAFKSDYGNYSDGFRKAFHHETISYYRRTDREYVDIENPKLSTVLSGTPQQVASLIPSAENGLFSRFIFYAMNVRPVWKNVFESKAENGLEAYFDNLGYDFYNLYGILMKEPELQFTFTVEQQDRFNDIFSEMQQEYIGLQGLDYMASVRRLGVIAFRLAMVLSVLRIMEHGEIPDKLICEERDFNTVAEMIKVLVRHSAKVFDELPKEIKRPTRQTKVEKFLNALPEKFNRKTYVEEAGKLGIPSKTAENYIAKFKKDGLLHHEGQDSYINLSINKSEEIKETEGL